MFRLEKWIRTTWFENHKASLSQEGVLQILTWKETGTNLYHVRYVFDGFYMYASGDIGSAIFRFTEPADPENISKYNLDYFYEKLVATSRDMIEFDSKTAMKRLREWLNELKESDTEYDHELMRGFFECARGCSSKEEWKEVIHDNGVFLSDLDDWYWDWIYQAGDVIPRQIEGLLVGLQMAAEQLFQPVEIN